MRFVSRSRKYSFSAQKGRQMILADGQRQNLTRDLYVRFTPGNNLLTEAEIEFGIKELNHRGLPIDRNTEQHFSPRNRLSGLDTEQEQKAQGWTDEERELVEQALLTSDSNGVDFLRLPEAPIQKPWATYADTPGQKVIGLANDLGIALTDVLAYERQNRNDAGLVYLLEQEIASADAVEEAEDAPVVIEA